MNQWLPRTLCSFLIAATMIACTSGSDSALTSTSGTSALTISGTLGGSSLLSANSTSNRVSQMAVTLSDLEIYAIAFTLPPVIGQANVGADGKFSVSMPGAKGAQVMAVFRDKTSLDTVGTVTFVDSSKKDLDGGNKESSSITLGDSVSLGALTLGSDGKVSVDVSQIATVVDTTVPDVAAAIDFNGQWTIAAYNGTLPDGYRTASNSSGQGGGGPAVGEPVYLLRYDGTSFTPNGSCTSESNCASSAGTAGTEPVYALSFWETAESIQACGFKTGFPADAARFHGHMNFGTLPSVTISSTTTPMTTGDYTLQARTGFGAANGAGDNVGCGETNGCGLPWMYQGAVSMHSMQDCSRTTIGTGSTAKNIGVCKMSKSAAADIYSAHVDGGGCVDANGKPLRVDFNLSHSNPTCTNVDETGDLAGFSTNTCTYNSIPNSSVSTAQSFTCKWTQGNFSTYSSGVLSGTPATNNPWMNGYTMSESVTQNAPCKTIVDTMTRYRCYAESYWQHADNAGGSGCYQEYNFNWGAKDPADFVMSGRERPKANFMTELLNYSADGKTASVERKEKNVVNIRTGQGEASCTVEKGMVLTFKSVSATQLLVDMKQTAKLADQGDPTCKAYIRPANCTDNDNMNDDNCEIYKNIKETGNMLFYLNK